MGQDDPASKSHAFSLLSSLLQAGRDLDAREFLSSELASKLDDRIFTGETWLHLAARSGCALTCSWLIANGSDVNDVGSGTRNPANALTPLVEAASTGDLATAQTLLEYGARVDGDVGSFVTPLMAACLEGRLHMVCLLLEHGAEVNRVHLNWNRTALDIAEVYGHEEIANLLRARGGLRLEGGPLDWSGVRGQPFIEHLEQKVGPVSPMALTHIVQGDLQLDLRFVQIMPKRQFKFLFTVGLCETPADIELAVCLPASWPLNQGALTDERWNWPIRLLFNLASDIAKSRVCVPGEVIERSDESLVGLRWPESVSRLFVSPVDASDLDNMMFLVPLAASAKVDTLKKRLALMEKIRAAKWTRLVVPS